MKKETDGNIFHELLFCWLQVLGSTATYIGLLSSLKFCRMLIVKLLNFEFLSLFLPVILIQFDSEVKFGNFTSIDNSSVQEFDAFNFTLS